MTYQYNFPLYLQGFKIAFRFFQKSLLTPYWTGSIKLQIKKTITQKNSVDTMTLFQSLPEFTLSQVLKNRQQ